MYIFYENKQSAASRNLLFISCNFKCKVAEHCLTVYPLIQVGTTSEDRGYHDVLHPLIQVGTTSEDRGEHDVGTTSEDK